VLILGFDFSRDQKWRKKIVGCCLDEGPKMGEYFVGMLLLGWKKKKKKKKTKQKDLLCC
jgi:hypothetical protein